MNKVHRFFFITSLIISMPLCSMDKNNQQDIENDPRYLERLKHIRYLQEHKNEHKQACQEYMTACENGNTYEASQLLCQSNLFKKGLHYKINPEGLTGLQLAFEKGHTETAQALFPLHTYLREQMSFEEWVNETYPEGANPNPTIKDKKKKRSFLKIH